MEGKKEVCFLSLCCQQGGGAGLVPTPSPSNWAGEAVCSWAEKLQLKMYDFGLLEGESQTLVCADTWSSGGEQRPLITSPASRGPGTTPSKSPAETRQAQRRLQGPHPSVGDHLGLPRGFRKGHFGNSIKPFCTELVSSLRPFDACIEIVHPAIRHAWPWRYFPQPHTSASAHDSSASLGTFPHLL